MVAGVDSGTDAADGGVVLCRRAGGGVVSDGGEAARPGVVGERLSRFRL